MQTYNDNAGDILLKAKDMSDRKESTNLALIIEQLMKDRYHIVNKGMQYPIHMQ